MKEKELTVDITDNRFILWLASLFAPKSETIYHGFAYDSYQIGNAVFVHRSSLREAKPKALPDNVVPIRRQPCLPLAANDDEILE